MPMACSKYKARLVAKGSSQQFGIDYHGSFAPTVTLNAVRILTPITNNKFLHLHSIDVKTAFLHAPLEEECYMSIPHGAVPPRGGGANCVLLHKAVYGLKQAPREWNSHFVTFLFELRFRRLYTDIYIFIHGTTPSLSLCMLMTLTSCPPLCLVFSD